jgi:DNA-directed RNA polymerase specialized sigma24 family protein
MSCIGDIYIQACFGLSMDVFQKSLDSGALENLFSEKYGWLLGWALHLVHGDRMVAEDLVQDAFARFFLAGPKLDEVANIEALLYTYLKYVHLDHLRKLQHYPLEPISVVDYDNLRLGLREKTISEQVTVQDTLQRIASYLIWRKESLKSASMLILRYFHGYYPDEIMRIALVKRRNAVETALCEAREEVRLYIADPDRFHKAHLANPPEVIPLSSTLSSEQFILALQKIVFSSCRTECLPEEVLLASYKADHHEPIERRLLAHIVSCKHCLRLVSGFFQMAPPSERIPEESLGPDKSTRQRSKP